jgi:hypothetical protein
MLSANRRLVEAREESVKALLRSAAAKRRIAEKFRELIHDLSEEEDKAQSAPKSALSKNQSRRK